MDKVDECGNCTLKGDINGCLKSHCNQHTSWYAKCQQARIDSFEKDKSCALYIDYKKDCQALKDNELS